MITTYIGLGSNLCDPEQQLQRALNVLSLIPQTCLMQSSRFYYSKPLGPIAQPDYVNAVAELKTRLNPHQLFSHLQAIEYQQGRRRTQRWGPRTLDLDLLWYGDHTVETVDLVIPHPEMKNRDFVIRPLQEIAPLLVASLG